VSMLLLLSLLLRLPECGLTHWAPGCSRCDLQQQTAAHLLGAAHVVLPLLSMLLLLLLLQVCGPTRAAATRCTARNPMKLTRTTTLPVGQCQGQRQQQCASWHMNSVSISSNQGVGCCVFPSGK
jgi:hypothetical protein